MSSEDFDMNDSTWMSADPHLASSLSPSQEERMRSPQNLHSQEDGECPLGSWQGGRLLFYKRPARAPGGGTQVTLGVPVVLESWYCQHLHKPQCPRERRVFS